VNGVDCGLHAIANAIEFVTEHGDPLANYDLKEMRQHLITCLETGKLQAFPKCKTKKRGRQGKVIVVDLDLNVTYIFMCCIISAT